MKEIPRSLEIEETVLAAMIVDQNAAMTALPVLKTSDIFYSLDHRKIFEAIQELYDSNQGIDLISVSQKLKSKGQLEGVGGEYALIKLTGKVATSAHVEHHSLLLLQFWVRRKMIDKAQKIMRDAFSDDVDSLELVERDARMNDEINDFLFSGKQGSTYAEALDEVGKRIEILSNQKEGEFTGLPTGYAIIDKFTGGWQPSDLVIVAARPGMGKTAFALKTAVECGRQGIPVGVFSLEMSAQQLAARTVAINSNFHLSQLIRSGFEKVQYFTTFNETKHEMQKFPILIDDTPALDIRDLITKARIWKRKHGIQILIVDYLQLIQDKRKGNNREQEIASISRNLKMLAKELNVPVIALSQLSRQVETRVDKRPRLSDLRESGAIEQDADIVTFLYRDHYYDKNAILPEDVANVGGNAEYSFAKYRQGSLETIPLYFDENKVKYRDPDGYRTIQELRHNPTAEDYAPF